ncbi:MAG TPA: tRNA uridine-5-carboxymethylaminomethyl(34) synthesis GTPase MnmE [archaeon]|nr:tRNA uridine-5-carboxymethylaminomethyl(34) synthesis GTPase MnmE [archaeon]
MNSQGSVEKPAAGRRLTLEPDTIVAVSTAQGIGAVALVRMSGTQAWQVAGKMIQGAGKFDRLEVRKSALFTLCHPESGDKLDNALVVKYKGPESFTGEDVVEFQCHGGLAVPLAVTGAAIAAGARQAQEGEFTRRAFLNRKLDLTQAEAIDSLVHASSEPGRKLALSGLGGELGQQIESLRELLLDLKAELEYSIDFPEEEQHADLYRGIRNRKEQAVTGLEKLLQGAQRNIVISRGALAVIAGAPNVGKSLLFNRLLGRERSIVTELAGTTRDAVEMETMIGGLLFRLVDTAGLRKSRGRVEKIGVEYSRRYMEQADLVLFVHEAGAGFKKKENEFLKTYGDKNILKILNKIDLIGSWSGPPEGYIPVSALKATGLEELKQAMVSSVMPEAGEKLTGPRVNSIRQKNLLEQAKSVLSGIDEKMSAELVAADLEEACGLLGEITGKITSEDVLGRIFSRFCIGK